VFAESFAPLIYSVPAFLGVTLARADMQARSFLASIWADEVGHSGVPSHPSLFEAFHRRAIASNRVYPEQHQHGIAAACEMIALCGSGPWPIGIAAMLAHEREFPNAYASLMERASAELGEDCEFFRVHAVADLEHTTLALSLLDMAVERQVAAEDEIQMSHKRSRAVLRDLADRAWDVLR